jgi:cell division transport system ATP-binding protein
VRDVITFEQVTRRFGERLALDGLSWHMDEGECLVFLGHSGAGKTTLLRLITHEIQPTAGKVIVGTFRGGRLSRRQRALLRRTLGIIYEDFRLLHDRTVFENVAIAVRIAGHFRDDEVIPRVMYALEEVGLHQKQAAFPHELSFGEKQRVAIARAIVNRPAVILADEPTGALEKRSADDVLTLLRRIHDEGAALLLVTTRHDVAAALPGRVLELAEGRLLDSTHAYPPGMAPPAPAQTEATATFESEGGALAPEPEFGNPPPALEAPEAENPEASSASPPGGV